MIATAIMGVKFHGCGINLNNDRNKINPIGNISFFDIKKILFMLNIYHIF
jgi:hypothetical protein